MKYSVRQYASALLDTLRDKTEKEKREILLRFWRILTKNNDQKLLGLIIAVLEKKHLKEKGFSKMELESAAPASAGLKKEIERLLGKKLIFYEKFKPELLAGIKILIDDEYLIDASARTQLAKLFS